ncbi:hypothetical protein EDD30_3255 [Couchioplanes caeruleus]|uniref:Uncharacterized protein n=1 Tax=Couchioplanes caeruleus TaxID=56438 RepID=A0A3N1GJM0_9ACTN|nr:hypothetical protein EDD30_3255 [Couchioplanes caeruleus]
MAPIPTTGAHRYQRLINRNGERARRGHTRTTDLRREPTNPRRHPTDQKQVNPGKQQSSIRNEVGVWGLPRRTALWLSNPRGVDAPAPGTAGTGTSGRHRATRPTNYRAASRDKRNRGRSLNKALADVAEDAPTAAGGSTSSIASRASTSATVGASRTSAGRWRTRPFGRFTASSAARISGRSAGDGWARIRWSRRNRQPPAGRIRGHRPLSRRRGSPTKRGPIPSGECATTAKLRVKRVEHLATETTYCQITKNWPDVVPDVPLVGDTRRRLQGDQL